MFTIEDAKVASAALSLYMKRFSRNCMQKDLITRLHKTFENIIQHDDGVEFWYARDLQPLLEYTEWRNFLQVIEKAKLSCYNARFKISHHFVDVNKMVDIGSGSQREIADIKLTRAVALCVLNILK